jgi:hypothetical protein
MAWWTSFLRMLALTVTWLVSWVLIGRGDGTFRRAVAYPTGQRFARWVVVGEFTGDEHNDLVVANAVSASLSVFAGRGDGTFEEPDTLLGLNAGTGFTVSSVGTGDFNEDGRSDLTARLAQVAVRIIWCSRSSTTARRQASQGAYANTQLGSRNSLALGSPEHGDAAG